MQFDGAIELLFVMSTEVVIDVDAWQRVKIVIAEVVVLGFLRMVIRNLVSRLRRR